MESLTYDLRPNAQLALSTPHPHVSSSEQSTGQVFLDDGEEAGMGGDGGNWTSVGFSSTTQNGSVHLSSKVENEGFGLNQKVIIDNVTFIGLQNAGGVEAYTFNITKGANSTGDIKASLDSSQRFVPVQISGVAIPIGTEFELELKHGSALNSSGNKAFICL